MGIFAEDRKVSIKNMLIVSLFFSGCAGQLDNLYTEVKPDFKDREIKRIGIVKFENQSLDPNAGLKVANIFYNALSFYGHYKLIAPAEMSGKGFGMEFVKKTDYLLGLPAPVDKIEESEIIDEKRDKDLGERPDLDAIVTGVITRYNDKDGSTIAVNRPASVAFKVFLIRVKDNKVLWSVNFAETQQALFDNLLLAERFHRAGGVWLTSDALAELGMQRVMKVFPGLVSDKVKLVTE